VNNPRNPKSLLLYLFFRALQMMQSPVVRNAAESADFVAREVTLRSATERLLSVLCELFSKTSMIVFWLQ
jgi:hypothetical protein